MTTLTAGLIDVFAETPLSGNPLAVVEGADGLSESQMRRIAGEFSQAETTFVMRSDRADFRLRSFTAIGAEVVGAGHNALGAWLWLADQGRLGDLRVPRTFQQEIGDVVLPIVLQSIDGRVVGRMKQSPLKLSTRLDRPEALAAALALPSADIVTTPPPRTADTGANHLLVRVTDPTVVDRAEPKAAALLEVLRATTRRAAMSTPSTPPRSAGPMRASSTRPSAFGRTPPRGRPQVPSPPISPMPA